MSGGQILGYMIVATVAAILLTALLDDGKGDE